MRHAPSLPRSTKIGFRLRDKQCSSALRAAALGETNTGSYLTDTEDSFATSMIGFVAQADNQKNENTVIIRLADFKRDALAIMDGARDFRSRVEFGSLFPPDTEFVEAVSRIVILESVEILVAEYEGEIVGGIGILYGPYIWNPKRLVAEELFWWAAKTAPLRAGWKLIYQAMKNIDERNAIPMFSTLATSPQGVEKTYRRLGLKPVETKFARF